MGGGRNRWVRCRGGVVLFARLFSRADGRRACGHAGSGIARKVNANQETGFQTYAMFVRAFSGRA
eukprot:30080-Lingulodinium_polyedra.AAC.1